MAACQSSLLCAPGLLLLLLIGVISSHLPEVQGSACHFWCSQTVRDSMVTATGLKTDDVSRKKDSINIHCLNKTNKKSSGSVSAVLYLNVFIE